VSITPIVIRRGQIDSASVIARDITKIKQLEREIRQAHKMEAVGMLAGGVAHDFNNVLTVIMSNCDLLRKPLAPDDPSRLMLDQIHLAGERAGLLTRQLLAFSAKQLLQPEVLNLNSVVNETEKMLSRLIGEDIIVSLVLDPTPGNVKADLGQIQQVLMNLAANSRDAMPQGGRLTIETKNVVLDQAYCSLHPDARLGNYSLLAVTDNGIGMDEKTKARIFDPFFTTKESGKGTGLGMATVYGIAKQIGGHIDVCSELGQGTTFTIYLPQVQEPIESRALHPDHIAVPEGEETVLLAEDDDAVGVVTAHMLQSCGYRVLEAANGEEAFELSESHKGPIDLLVCDVVMPDFSGRKLAERIAGRRPDLKVLFISGYTDDAVIRYGILESEIDFLQKPFTLANLAQKIRKVLDRPDESE
jgi:two-component system, cell cycle sensor histidine kinase and response regulator CckA